MISKLINAKEVAELLRISGSKSYSMMQRRIIPSIRIGRSVRVQEEDLLHYIVINRKGNMNSN